MTTETKRPVRVETPPIDIFENADGFLLRADMPGVPNEGLTVELDKGMLTLQGQRPLTEDGERFMTYRRRFQVPRDIDGGKVSAHFEHGVLQVTLPRSEAAKPRKIPVVVG